MRITPLARAVRAGLVVALSGAVFGGALPTASATPSNPEIDAKRAEAEVARREMDDLADLAELRREEYLEITDSLKRTRGEIEETRAELDSARADQLAAEDALERRATGIYRSGGAHLLEVLLGTSSFGDFLTRMDWLRRVSRNDALLVHQVKDAVTAVEAAERMLERRESELVALRRQAEVKAREVDEALARQERFVAGLESEVARLVAEEEERLRREAEERARRAAAEAARRAAEEAARQAAAEEAARQAAAASAGSPSGTSQPSQPTRSAAPNSRTFDPSALGPGNPRAVVIGMQYLGVPYVWGGTTPAGFDCSGLTLYVYRELGISLPRTSRQQFTVGAFIPPDRRDLLLPGDLVFFGRNADPGQVHHVGIYVGGGDYLHAPSRGNPVQVQSFTTRVNERGDYVGATRP